MRDWRYHSRNCSAIKRLKDSGKRLRDVVGCIPSFTGCYTSCYMLRLTTSASSSIRSATLHAHMRACVHVPNVCVCHCSMALCCFWFYLEALVMIAKTCRPVFSFLSMCVWYNCPSTANLLGTKAELCIVIWPPMLKLYQGSGPVHLLIWGAPSRVAMATP